MYPFVENSTIIISKLFTLLLYLLILFVLFLLPSNISQPSPNFHPMTPSVQSAALFDPSKHFDGLNHTYPPGKFLANLSTRVFFHIGSQLLDIQTFRTYVSSLFLP